MLHFMGLKKNRGCTPHLFAILILAIFLIIIAKFTFRGLPEPQALSMPTPSPQALATLSPTPAIEVAILPKSAIVTQNQKITLQIVADTPGLEITAVDISLRYDKNKLIFQTASPSSFFREQMVFANTVDGESGSVRVALGSLIPATRSGTLFLLLGQVLPGASGSAEIVIMPESRVGSVGTATSLLGKVMKSVLTIISANGYP